MQQLASIPGPDQQANRGGAPRSQVILIIALLLFSVAGLASGFSVGALSRPQQAKQNNTSSMVPIQPQARQAPTPQKTKSVDILAVGIGCPVITITPSYAQTVDNTTVYTVEAQAKDESTSKTGSCGVGKPLLAAGITCKIWLTKDVESLQNLQTTSNKMLTDINMLQNTFPHEKTNILLLNGNGQVQNCNASGIATWKYSLAPDTNSGTYFIAVLTDWKGLLANWSWKQITVTKAN